MTRNAPRQHLHCRRRDADLLAVQLQQQRLARVHRGAGAQLMQHPSPADVLAAIYARQQRGQQGALANIFEHEDVQLSVTQ